jgi:hypothetical protein
MLALDLTIDALDQEDQQWWQEKSDKRKQCSQIPIRYIAQAYHP